MSLVSVAFPRATDPEHPRVASAILVENGIHLRSVTSDRLTH